MRILGLDVGSRWIKGTVLTRGMFGAKCTHAFRRPATAAPLPEQLAAVVREEAPGADLVVLSLPRDQVFTRNVTLPFKDSAKIKAVVPGVAEQNLPFPLRDAVVRHLVTDDAAPALTHVMLLVMNRRDLEPISAALAGLRVHEATAAVDALAMVNAWLDQAAGGPPVVLVDVGARKTCVEVVSGGKLVFSRWIGVGGDAFSGAVAAKLKVPLDEAEALKIAVSSSEEVDAQQAEQVKAALADAYKKLTRELKLTVLSARNLWPTMELAGVKLCGGSAAAAGLVQAVSEGVGLPAETIGSPLLAPQGMAAASDMLTSAGLALAGARRARLEVDFLGRPRDIVRFHRREIGLVSVILVSIVLVSYVAARRDLALLRAESEDADREIDAGLARIGQLTKQRVDRATLDAVAGQLRKQRALLAEDAGSRMAVLNEIAQALPRDLEATFRSISIERGQVEIEAETDSFETVQKIENALRQALNRNIDVEAPHNEQLPDKRVTVFRLRFPADGEVRK